MMRGLGSIAVVFLLSACSMFGVRSGTEQASYTVVAELDGNAEVRRYPRQLVAETTVAAPDERSGRSKAFRALFDYISGANRSQAKVAMTTPVETAAGPEKIAMTVPVETKAQATGSYTMRFFLPAGYTLETAPRPTDPDVRLFEVPERMVAALRFGGSRDAANVARHRSDLDMALDGSGWRAAGEPFSLFYDPPWTIPFLRRNEVAVPVVGG